MMDYYQKKSDDVLVELKSSEQGLSSKVAKSRLKKYGKNKIVKVHKFHGLKVLLNQFKSFLIYLLIVASLISFFVGHFVDGVVILCILVLNAGIGFFQTYKAERAIEKLRKLLVLKSKVIRDSKVLVIDSEDLVVGDIVVFSAGDKVSADLRIIDSDNLQANEAVLTGESLPVDKVSRVISKKVPLAERSNMLYAGTEVVRGSCKAVVVKTAMDTVFGDIATSLSEIEIQSTPIQKKMDLFSKQVGLIILGIVAFVIALGVFGDFDVMDMFMVGVALAVSAIPEGLPAVLAIGFAISSYMMSKSNVIVRRLPAVESLGSVTVICSDKTGTITEEKMSIKEYYSGGSVYEKKDNAVFVNNKNIDVKKNKDFSLLVKTSILCNDAKYSYLSGDYGIVGDPTEGALLVSSLDLGYDKKILIEKEPKFKKFDFDSKRKMMSIIRRGRIFKTMYSKGAPEVIVKASSHELINGEIVELTEKRKLELLKVSEEMSKRALRVLGFAYKEVRNKDFEEEDLVFLGFGGMIDPPRKEVKDAIRECYDAQIKVKMITGDSKETAVAIAK
ncbi:HAD-IC family P-type ATPase, partial [Candidatus Pacearchaeota archaeon]|nr:HAD-IC family P-type ATPase [Candidatus Pacearchaeota archaeon]